MSVYIKAFGSMGDDTAVVRVDPTQGLIQTPLRDGKPDEMPVHFVTRGEAEAFIRDRILPSDKSLRREFFEIVRPERFYVEVMPGEIFDLVERRLDGSTYRAGQVYNKEDAEAWEKALAVMDSLSELASWMRTHTGPRDGTHDILLRAMQAGPAVDIEIDRAVEAEVERMKHEYAIRRGT